MKGPYKVGDIVSYYLRHRSRDVGIRLSVGSGIVGVEVDDNHPDKKRITAWLIC